MEVRNTGMKKTYKESWFTRFSLDGLEANYLLKPYQFIKNGKYDTSAIRSYNEVIYNQLDLNVNPAVILQIMLCDDNSAIAELISESDLKKYDSNQDRDERQLLIDDIDLAIKLLRNPYISIDDINNCKISSLVKNIIDDTPIKCLDEVVVKIWNLLTYWGKIVTRIEEVSAIYDDTGLSVSDKSGLLIVNRVILSKLKNVKIEVNASKAVLERPYDSKRIRELDN